MHFIFSQTGVDAKLNIEREDMALLGEVNLSLRLQKRKVRHLFSVEATSEGYETMTEASEVVGSQMLTNIISRVFCILCRFFSLVIVQK